ncbi:MAG: SWIM zinc finger family protein [Anaerolineae bacterium]
MKLPKLSESIIRAASTPSSFERGQNLDHSHAISNAAIQGNLLLGNCEGTQEPYYQVRVELDEGGIRTAQCTCAYEYGGLCKHTVALLLTYVHQPKQFVVRQDPAELLAALDHDELVALMTRLVRERPELYDWIEVAIAAPATAGQGKKKRRKKVDTEVYRRQVRNILHSLDGMRASEAYGYVGGLVGQLGEVQATAMKFLDADEPETALAILMALVEEAGHGVEYIDDSDGELGDFMSRLGQPLAEVILSLDMSAVEREKLVRELEKQARYLADYGMDEGLDLAIRAATVGWDEEPTQGKRSHSTRSRRPNRSQDEEESDQAEEEEYDDAEYGEETSNAEWQGNLFGDLTDAKLNVLQRQGRRDEYLALCQKTGRHLRYALMLCDLNVLEAITYAEKHLTTAEDAYKMAARLRELGHIAKALALGEHGLKLAGSRVQLGEWLGPLEEAQGRTQQALQAWLAAFPEHPTLAAYENMKRLAGDTWPDLQPKVIERLRKSHDAMTLAQVLLSEQEWDEAIKVAERREVWYGVIETVADAVISQRPEWVARMSIKQAERLMGEAKSERYPLAANWLKKAKQAYVQLGQTREWQAYLQKVKEQYKRRPALQAQLQRL